MGEYFAPISKARYAELLEAEAALAAAEAARDDALRSRDHMQRLAAQAAMSTGEAVDRLVAAEQRATRLAALEAAARAWAREYDGFLDQPPGVDLPTLEAGIQALLDAVAALDALPGEPP